MTILNIVTWSNDNTVNVDVKQTKSLNNNKKVVMRKILIPFLLILLETRKETIQYILHHLYFVFLHLLKLISQGYTTIVCTVSYQQFLQLTKVLLHPHTSRICFVFATIGTLYPLPKYASTTLNLVLRSHHY